MWELNFEDINKLHMSMGAGLMLAAILLYLATFWNVYDRLNSSTLDKYEKEVNLTKYPYYYEIKISQLRSINGMIYFSTFLSIFLIIIGSYFFIKGYRLYLKKK
mgnify:CR=1 FL=1